MIFANSCPVSREGFRIAVETWESKGHKNVVQVEFDDDTGEMILLVQDYVNPADSYYLRCAPWTDGEAHYAQ